MITNGQLPNGESQFIDQVIAEYLQAEAKGQSGDRQQWLDRYPACAIELNEFLDDRERLKQIVGPVQHYRQRSKSYASSDNSPSDQADGVQTVELAPLAPKLSTTRYSPVRFHARGGMGEIWLAKDERVGRHVALKKLRAGRENQHLRFVAEAQITGQLEHPSVVPLHDIGVDDTGQPFYVMKFIHGRRFKETIAEFHAQKEANDWPASLDFRRLLEALVSVCNVVAYAHHKGVVHRDIKPDNIMLGPYGEIVVVDWGLAKLVGQEEEQRGSAVRLSGSGSTATQEGAIVGSPCYMSPEGAKGQPDAVDESSDVYLLGATLYEILCARPPRQATSSWELIDLALHSRPKSPRTIDAQIPKPLEAICLKAMAFDKQDRCSSPLDLANDLERYLAGAQVSAYAEPFLDRAQRWVRRHRRSLAKVAAASVLVALAAFAYQQQRAASLLTARETARHSLDEYHQLADEAQFFAANTDAISERVPYYDPRRALDVGNAALTIAEPWGKSGLDLPLGDRRAEFVQSQYALLLLMAQTKQHSLDPRESPKEVLAILDRARELTTPTQSYFSIRAECLASLGESQAAELDRKRAAAPATPATAQDFFIAGEKLRMQDAGASAQEVNDSDHRQSGSRREHLLAALDEYRRALQLDPQHFWARFQSGRCLLALGRGPESIEVLSGCIAMRPDSPWAYATRGLASAIDGRYDAALGDLNRAIELDANFQPARLNRGLMYTLQGNSELAINDFTNVLSANNDRQLYEAALYRGQLYLDRKDFQMAAADFTTVVEASPECRLAYWYRSQARFRLGQNDAAIADIKSFVGLDPAQSASVVPAAQHLAMGKTLRNVAQQLPIAERDGALSAATDELQAAIDLGPPTAEMWRHLGAVHELRSAPAVAIDAYTRGLKLDPQDPQLRNMRAWVHANSHELDAAQSDFEAILDSAPDNAEAHAGLGFVLAELGREDDSRREASVALLAATDDQLLLHNIACIYGRLSAAKPERSDEYENLAIALLQRAVSISRTNPMGLDANEITLLRSESSFPDSLKHRPEFGGLLEVSRR